MYSQCAFSYRIYQIAMPRVVRQGHKLAGVKAELLRI